MKAAADTDYTVVAAADFAASIAVGGYTLVVVDATASFAAVDTAAFAAAGCILAAVDTALFAAAGCILAVVDIALFAAAARILAAVVAAPFAADGRIVVVAAAAVSTVVGAPALVAALAGVLVALAQTVVAEVESDVRFLLEVSLLPRVSVLVHAVVAAPAPFVSLLAVIYHEPVVAGAVLLRRFFASATQHLAASELELLSPAPTELRVFDDPLTPALVRPPCP